MKKISNLTASLLFIILTGCGGSSSSTNNTENLSSQTKEQSPQETNIVKLLYYSYKIRKKLEITHRLSRST
ncbi:hypothetical protein V6353_17010, partial [Acinetobacter baumannii]